MGLISYLTSEPKIVQQWHDWLERHPHLQFSKAY